MVDNDDNKMPDLKDCSDDKDEDNEDAHLAEEEFDQNQASANTDCNIVTQWNGFH